MSKWLAVGAVVALVTGCNYGNGAFVCSATKPCGTDGFCEADGRCSFMDTRCQSGQRYGGLAGDTSNECVPVNVHPDAGVGNNDDASTPTADAQACFGTGIVKICLASAPMEAMTLPARIDTSDNTCAKNVISGGTGYCVLAATDITINATLRAVGPNPLVLIASNSITSVTDALIDAGSRRNAAGATELGAGADPKAAGMCSAGNPPVAQGGGAGGSFTGLGGAGGDGNLNNGVPGAVVPPPIAALRGGCAGQDGAGTPNSKGHGGGAVFLIAGIKIEIAGGINAGGEGGGGGNGAKGGSGGKGGGGGGAGGMIGLDAPTITVTGPLIANGGGGGEGGSQTNNGNDGGNGADALGAAAAAGGTGGSTSGGDGGAGSSGAEAGAGVAGTNNNGGGAGGGGGGAGLVKAPPAAVGTNASPAATP